MPTVLITDDEADHRELLTLALHRLGYEVVAAENAAEAFAILCGGGIDAVLTDVRMPGESGVELCRRIRDDPRTESIPVMMVSADVQRTQITAALHAGADDFLPKPFSRAELTARLNNLMRPCAKPALRSALAARAAVLAARQSLPTPQPVSRPLRRIA
ncbi:CheY-like chemotaxis protein [Actinoplanes lutulentus]|uniref:Response regulator receiver domain-containing protein n=1 Tax=Actinoplanes lutulentus TaxID=1287878 RepID=A0A327Z654_9ACTN|nr:response regulator [Actinoplanes lutulentus]MBB2945164.1 CheY-like chemotaxis protein [Actinoplanes lutulentus]RAK31960.1 response regulator receiver domain-containing protein [Actinoplanes lutulentus]